MQNSIQITITNCSQEQRDVLLAKMSIEGYDNFEEVGEDSLVASVFESSFDEEFIKELQESFSSLFFNVEQMAARNWNEEWEKSFEPIVVADKVGIRANFHPKNESVKYDLVITPKMSFGTGHHATTHLMVALMQEVDFVGKKVFDFGTGTGVLAILAEKMGAAEIMAIDIDAWSVFNTEENMLANGCSKIKVIEADRIPDGEKAEIVLANITLNVISAHISAIASIMPAQGKLFCSGVLLADKEKLEEVLKLHDFKVDRLEVRNGWIACLSTKTS